MDGHADESQAEVPPTSIVGRQRRQSALGRSLPLIYVGFAVFQVWRGNVVLASVFIIGAGALTVLVLRPPTVVDATGISRPWRVRRRFITWPEVDSIVIQPTGLEPRTAPRVALVGGGRPVVLDGIPPDQAELVARIGGRPVTRPPMPGTTAPPPREKVATDVDRQADAVRRAADLQRGWAELQDENRHRPPGRSRSNAQPKPGDFR